MLLGCAMFCVTSSMQASAAGPYDGKWVGTAPEAGDCGMLTVTMTITNNAISGTVSGKHGGPQIEPASIQPDGTAWLSYKPFQGSVKISGSNFTGQFNTFCGVRAVKGTKQ